jgi:hypothetical protein
MTYHYNTVFSEGEPFYVFTRNAKSKTSIGCIPAGISYVYRGKIYTTATLLTLIFERWQKGGIQEVLGIVSKHTTPKDWKHTTRTDFVSLFKH